MTLPAHSPGLAVAGSAFEETAEIVRIGGSWADGVFTDAEADPVAVRVVTSPVTGAAGDARVRVLTEGGIQLDALRVFWLPVEVVSQRSGGGPESSGDLILYRGERWRASDVQRWLPDFFEVLAVREEGQ